MVAAFKNFGNYFKSVLRNKNSLFYYVIFLILLGVAFYAGSLFWNGFTITASGDYVVQDIPFYYNGWDDWHRIFTTGELPYWDTNTFLGVDNFSNNTFYYFFNPFFFICCLFPRAWLVQMMSIMFILKNVLAALFMRLLLKEFNVKEWTARFFGLCYGFGGWMVFYIWFCSYLDVGVFLPLILLGIERVLKRKSPYILIIGVALTGFSNFFFLVPICIGTVIYALFRLIQTANTRTVKDNLIALGIGILSFALGLFLCGFVIIPSFLNVMNYNRSGTPYLQLLSEAKDEGDWGKVFSLMFNWNAYYSTASSGLIESGLKGYRIFYPIMSFLFPASDGRNVSILNVVGTGNRYDEVCSSLFLYTPTLIIFFASIFKSIHQKKVSHLLAIAFWVFCLFTPFMYFFFMFFTSMYGRWEILPYAFICIYCAISFNDRKGYKRWYFYVSFLITAVLLLYCVYLAYSLPQVYDSYILAPNERWGIMLEEGLILFVCFVLISIFYRKEGFTKWGHLILVAECVVMGVMFTFSHGYTNYWSTNFMGGLSNIAEETEIFNRINDKQSPYYDPSYYRVQSGRMLNNGINIQMMENYNGTAFFHSTYNNAQDQYLAWARISRSPYNWVGESVQKKPLQDTFLGVKYYLTKRVETNFSSGGKVIHVDENLPWGYEKTDVCDAKSQYTLWENKNFIELGFSYDTVLDNGVNEDGDIVRSAEKFFNNYGTNELNNDYNFLTSAVLSTKQIDELKAKYPEEFDSGIIKEGEYTNSPNLVTYYNGRGTLQNRFDATLYTLPSAFNPEKPLEYLTVGNSSNQTKVLNYGTDIVVLEPASGSFNYDTDTDIMLSIDKYISQNYKYSYFLIDEDGKTITYENTYLYSHGGTYRYNRPIYSKGRKVSKIICISHHNSSDGKTKSSITPSYIYKWDKKEFDKVLDNLRAYPLENVTHTNNTYSFETNYENRRLIILQLGYSKGWTVEATLENGTTKKLDVMNGNGGWVTFMGEPGAVKYTAKFKTPYFNGGVALAGISILSMAAFGIYYSLRNKGLIPWCKNYVPKEERYDEEVIKKVKKMNKFK